MNILTLIEKKKRGEALSEEEIAFFVRSVTDGTLPDYQIAAFLMAVVWRGMDLDETTVLTREMMLSGDTLDLSRFGRLSVDKHSTGGVGDKTTLIVAPLAAACGAVVAKMSGRGLGFTGGTVDKLESIPGYHSTLSPEAFMRQSGEVGVCVVGQSKDLAPADKHLYALRDVTGTVDSIPLIASSILSKKLAAGAVNIDLDVKFGNGAFMKTKESARELATTMIEVGRRLGRTVHAVLSDMNAPLGHAVGNAVEVWEAAETLRGAGDPDLTELCLTLTAELVAPALEISREEARARAEEALRSGKGFEKMKAWVRAQGGDPRALEDPALLPAARIQKDVLSPEEGYVWEMEAEKVGLASAALGAGRREKDDSIDPAAGILLRKKPGDRVERGEVLATLLTCDPEKLAAGEALFLSALSFGETAPAGRALIEEIL